MNRFQDKIAIVTGGASGIGRALCLELGRQGAVVIAADINIDGAKKTAFTIQEDGGKAHARLLDVIVEDDVKGLVDEVVKEHGRLDYIFNNAGIALAAEMRDMSLEHWRRIIDVDLWGVINGAMAAYKVMVDAGSGHIVNTASIAGLIAPPTMTAYAAAKHGVVGLSLALRTEARGLGVKVSAICPGVVGTELVDTIELLNVNRADINELTHKLLILDVDRAARMVLKGVLKNRAIIAIPFSSRLLWWVFRIHPVLVAPLLNKMLRDFRKIRGDS